MLKILIGLALSAIGCGLVASGAKDSLADGEKTKGEKPAAKPADEKPADKPAEGEKT